MDSDPLGIEMTDVCRHCRMTRQEHRLQGANFGHCDGNARGPHHFDRGPQKGKNLTPEEILRWHAKHAPVGKLVGSVAADVDFEPAYRAVHSNVEEIKRPANATKCLSHPKEQRWLGDRYEACNACMVEMNHEILLLRGAMRTSRAESKAWFTLQGAAERYSQWLKNGPSEAVKEEERLLRAAAYAWAGEQRPDTEKVEGAKARIAEQQARLAAVETAYRRFNGYTFRWRDGLQLVPKEIMAEYNAAIVVAIEGRAASRDEAKCEECDRALADPMGLYVCRVHGTTQPFHGYRPSEVKCLCFDNQSTCPIHEPSPNDAKPGKKTT